MRIVDKKQTQQVNVYRSVIDRCCFSRVQKKWGMHFTSQRFTCVISGHRQKTNWCSESPRPNASAVPENILGFTTNFHQAYSVQISRLGFSDRDWFSGVTKKEEGRNGFNERGPICVSSFYWQQFWRRFSSFDYLYGSWHMYSVWT